MSAPAIEYRNHRKWHPPYRLFNAISPYVNALIASRFHGLLGLGDILAVLHYDGRKSGKRYNTTIAYALEDDTLYISTHRRWASNLRGGAPVEVTLKGKRIPAVADVIDDPDAMIPAYEAMYWGGRRYATALGDYGGMRFGVNGEVARDEVVRVRIIGHMIVRVDLQQTGACIRSWATEALIRCPAARDIEHRAGRERHLPRAQEADHRRDFLRLPDAPHRDAADHVLDMLWRQLLQQFGLDHRRRHGVDQDALRGDLLGD